MGCLRAKQCAVWVVLTALILTLDASAQSGRAPRVVRRDRAAQRREGIRPLPPIRNGVRGVRQPAPLNLQRQRVYNEMMRRLNLTDDQQARMLDLRKRHDEQLIVAGRRARTAKRVLDQALMNDDYDEPRVSKLTEEFVAAQTEVLRINLRMRQEMRRVLTREQVIRFRDLEREFERRGRERRRTELDQPPPERPPE